MRMKANRQLPLNFAGTNSLTKEWYTLYSRIHMILEANPELLNLVHADITQRLNKAKRNVMGIATECILRLSIVQKIEMLSFRELMVRVDDSQMLRFFCRLYDDPIISYSKYANLVNLVQPATWEKVNAALVQFAQSKKYVEGKQLRLDTTAVETDIHYPTDSSLLLDGIRVLYRLICRLRALAPELVGTNRIHFRKAKRVALQLARGGSKIHKSQSKSLYRALLTFAEKLAQQAVNLEYRLESHSAPGIQGITLSQIAAELQPFRQLTEKCIEQARRRVLEEQSVPNSEKIFSIFETHTELLIRGKVQKPVEFGHMVELAQIEGGIISDYTVHLRRPVESSLLQDNLRRHQEKFGCVPELVAADKGYYSAATMTRAKEMGVDQVCIPKRGRRTEHEERREHSLWFKAGQAFRAGIEGTISVLKRAFSLRRCLSEGWTRFQSWVGSNIFAHNLVVLARK